MITSSNSPTTKLALARRAFVALALPATLAAATVATAGPAQAATPQTAPFGTPGSLVRTAQDGYLDWTVPAGTSWLHLHLVGGSGADGAAGAGAPGGIGGHGAIVDEYLTARGGQTLSLLPGSAAGLNGGETFYGDAVGGKGGWGDTHGNGGRGGAASWVTLDNTIVGVAGGGGGAGGGGAVYSYKGGDGGDAGRSGYSGTGPGAGAGASGNIAGSGSVFHGEDGSNAATATFAGGGGGGGAGWDGGQLGGGRAGYTGGYGGGGGGGAAGGTSYAIDKNATVSSRGVSGDGLVFIEWVVASPTTSSLPAPASAPQGRSVTLTDTITPSMPGGPLPSGKVTFEMEDIYSYVKTVFATVPVVNGVATFTSTTLPAGNYHSIHAIYSGDTNYQGSTSNFVYPNITAPIKTIGLNPTTVAFGNQAKGALKTKTVTLTNTGSIDWSWTSAATDNGDVNMPTTTCSSLKPGATCTVTVSFQPSALGPVSAHITLDSNFGKIAIPVTGTGVTPAPTVTKISPASGSHLGGTRVTITGTNFVNVTSITIGGVNFTALSCTSATTCQATTPAGTVGAHDIRVISATGKSAAVTADRYTFV